MTIHGMHMHGLCPGDPDYQSLLLGSGHARQLDLLFRSSLATVMFLCEPWHSLDCEVASSDLLSMGNLVVSAKLANEKFL